MSGVAEHWLTTGEAARLCSVKPDTVQKWIQKGRLVAQRTAGGHYRISLRDVQPFLTGPGLSRWFAAPPAGCRPQPLRCWEYLSGDGSIRQECLSCAVYRVRAAWCFQVLDSDSGLEHARRFCQDQSSCQDCSYYRLVCGLPAGVLVVTEDSALASALIGSEDDGLVLRFAASGYEASTVIGQLHPVAVVLDEDSVAAAETGLLDCLLRDPRAPGLRVILAGHALSSPHPLPNSERVIGRLRKPLERAAIASLLSSIEVERKNVPLLNAAAPSPENIRPNSFAS